jgi:excisionase family DNA binding protein
MIVPLEKQVLTLAGAATFLRLSRAEVQKLAQIGRLPGRQVGTEWRFLRSAVQDWKALTLPEASRFLRLRAGSMRRAAEAGEVPGQKVGKQWRFFKPHLTEWLRCGIGVPKPLCGVRDFD